MMAGRWEGVTPGNRLHADIESAGFHSLRHPYDLFLEVTGAFDEDNVRAQGFMHLESQGKDGKWKTFSDDEMRRP